jgi:hypothetical protein
MREKNLLQLFLILNVALAEDNAKVNRFVRALAPKLAVAPTNASIRLVDVTPVT